MVANTYVVLQPQRLLGVQRTSLVISTNSQGMDNSNLEDLFEII